VAGIAAGLLAILAVLRIFTSCGCRAIEIVEDCVIPFRHIPIPRSTVKLSLNSLCTARGSLVKALGYKPEGREFETR
jgi:hypothetical protein